MFTEAEPWVQDSYAVWQFIELNMGIIAASLPATKPLLSMCFDPTKGFSRGERTAENDGNNSQGALQERGARHNEEPHGQEAPPQRARRRHSLSISLAETLYNPRASVNRDAELEELYRRNKKGVVGAHMKMPYNHNVYTIPLCTAVSKVRLPHHSCTTAGLEIVIGLGLLIERAGINHEKTRSCTAARAVTTLRLQSMSLNFACVTRITTVMQNKCNGEISNA
jgi:hypothetical protein